VGLDGQWLRVNRRLCDMLGYSREELATRTFQEVTHADDLAEDLAHAERLFRGAIPYYQLEKRYIRKDGTVMWARLTGSLVRRHDQSVEYAVGVVEDITEHKREEAARRETEERFRALIETASDVITVVDPEARVLYVSPSVQHVFGFAPSELEGRPLLELLNRADRPEVIGAIDRVMRAPDSSAEVTVRLRRRDGNWRINEAAARNLLSDPAVRGIVITTRDTTERTLLEEQLREAQKMEAVGRLAGGVAHDFNNLLTAVHGFTSVAIARLPEDSQVAVLLRKVLDAAEAATRLTRQLLTFSRRERVVPAVVDLRELAASAAKMLEPIIGAEVALSLSLSDAPCYVLSDQGQMEQLVLNLAINARDALPQGGTVEISVEPREVPDAMQGSHGTIAPGRYVALCVSDTGHGIPASVIPHIFEPFFTTKQRGRGTGLGLATVYGIVVRAGGYVDVQCPPEGGTVFTILLPESVEAPPPQGAPEPESLPKGRGECVLVAEDDAAVRELIGGMLRDLGYLVLEARLPAEAITAIAGGVAADVLLTDVVMPGMNGFELARRLVALRPGLPVLYMSGYAGDELQVRGLPPEIDLLEKPFTVARLARAVRRVIEG
jgi:PAS domain S-box-containing protein